MFHFQNQQTVTKEKHNILCFFFLSATTNSIRREHPRISPKSADEKNAQIQPKYFSHFTKKLCRRRHFFPVPLFPFPLPL